MRPRKGAEPRQRNAIGRVACWGVHLVVKPETWPGTELSWPRRSRLVLPPGNAPMTPNGGNPTSGGRAPRPSPSGDQPGDDLEQHERG